MAVQTSPEFDIGELHVPHDLQLVDAAQVLHPMPELEQVGAVDGELELMRLTEEKDLKKEGKFREQIPNMRMSL